MAYLLRYCHCSRLLPPEKNTNYQYWQKDVFGHYLEFYQLLFDQPHSSIVSRMLNKEEFSNHFLNQSNPNTFLENKYFWLDTVLRAARWCWWHTTLGNGKRVSTFSLSLSSKNIRFFFIRNRFKDTEPGCVVGLLRGVDNSESGGTFNFSLVSTL